LEVAVGFVWGELQIALVGEWEKLLRLEVNLSEDAFGYGGEVADYSG
jgi:hypothetical protein